MYYFNTQRNRFCIAMGQHRGGTSIVQIYFFTSIPFFIIYESFRLKKLRIFSKELEDISLEKFHVLFIHISEIFAILSNENQ